LRDLIGKMQQAVNPEYRSRDQAEWTRLVNSDDETSLYWPVSRFRFFLDGLEGDCLRAFCSFEAAEAISAI